MRVITESWSRSITRLVAAGLIATAPGWLCVIDASRAHADVPRGSVAVVVTMTTDDDPTTAEELAKAVQQAAQARGAAMIDDGSTRVSARHSAPAVRPAADRLASLRGELDAVTRHLALGELQEAIKRMKTIEALHHDALDFLSREAAQARKLFQACVMTGYLLHEKGRVSEGSEQLRTCAASFPGYELHKEVFADDVRSLYVRVTTQQDAQQAWLLVEGIDGVGCDVRLNGINVGSAPLQVRTRPSMVRVQLECGSGLGRIHTIKLRRGKQKVRIDAGLEEALDTTDEIPMLRHVKRLPEERLVRQLVEIGKAIDVDNVLQVHRAEEGWELALIDVSARVAAVRVEVDEDHSGAGVGRLFAAARLEGDDIDGDGVAGGSSSGSKRSLIGTGRVDGAYFALVGTVWALSPIASVLVLKDRRQIRLDIRDIERSGAQSASDQERMNELGDDYNTIGGLGYAFAGVPSLWLAVSSMFLPDTDGIPWYAWLTGGVGATAVAVGVSLRVGSDLCSLEWDGRHCGMWTADKHMGPYLIVHGVGPLSVLISYLIGEAVDSGKSRTSARIHVGDESASFILQGAF